MSDKAMAFEEIEARAAAHQTFECLAKRSDRDRIVCMVDDYDMQVWERRFGDQTYEILVEPLVWWKTTKRDD